MRTRILWIDIIKSFAIFTVVLGHMISCEAFASQVGVDVYNEFILAFHMPLFTILSGWFFSTKRDVIDFVKVKSSSILLPYIVWCAVWFFISPIMSMMISGQELHVSSIIWQMKYFLNDALCCYGWWFLRGLFFTMILAYLSVKFAELCGKKIKEHAYAWGGTVSCIILYVLCFCGVVPNQPVKDSLFKGFIYMYPFFWSGYLLRLMWERKQEALGSAKWIFGMSIFFVGLLFVWDGIKDPFYGMNTSALEVSGANGVFGAEVVYRTIFRLFIGVVGSFAFILVFSKLFAKESRNKLRVFSQNIGKETLGIYILQSLVYWSLPKYDIFGWGEWGNFMFAVVLSFVIVVVSYFIIRLTSQNKWLGLVLWGKSFEKRN